MVAVTWFRLDVAGCVPHAGAVPSLCACLCPRPSGPAAASLFLLTELCVADGERRLPRQRQGDEPAAAGGRADAGRAHAPESPVTPATTPTPWHQKDPRPPPPGASGRRAARPPSAAGALRALQAPKFPRAGQATGAGPARWAGPPRRRGAARATVRGRPVPRAAAAAPAAPSVCRRSSSDLCMPVPRPSPQRPPCHSPPASPPASPARPPPRARQPQEPPHGRPRGRRAPCRWPRWAMARQGTLAEATTTRAPQPRAAPPLRRRGGPARERRGGGGGGGGGPAAKPVYPEDYNYLKGLVPELKSDIRERDLRIDLLESEMLDLRRQVKRKTEELTRLQRDVHKLRSVLQQQAVRFHEHGDLLATLHEQHSMAGQGSMTKKQGVSGESCFQNKTAEKIHIQRFDKDFR
nr:uncharacterized protein LOC113818506 [Penaeus vannamei]